jgi:uncharacterized protein YcfJ
MKKLVLAFLVVGTLASARAQLFNPDSVNGTLFGALVGGLIGNGINHQGWEGAGIGAASGFVLGNLAYGARQPQTYSYGAPYATPYSFAPVYSYTPPSSSFYSPPAYAYAYAPYPAYAPAPPRRNYAIGGTLLGALTGGLIGNSIDHQGWEGAAIGAGAGLLLGGVAEQTARRRQQDYYYAGPPVLVVRPKTLAPAPSAPTVPDNNPKPPYRPASAMSSANSLFGR